MPGLGELLPVLLENPGRFRLGLFRAFEAAFDLVGALLQGLLDPRQQRPCRAKPKTMRNAIVPMMSSVSVGISGFCDPDAAASRFVIA